MGSTLPYIPLVAQNRIGVSATSFAVVSTSQQFITILSRPAIGYITDYFNKLKLMIILLIIIQVIFNFLLLIIPPIEPSTSTSPIINALMNKDQHSEIFILNITNCYDPESPSPDFTLNTTMDQKYIQKNNERTEYNLMCMRQYNDSEIICYEGNAENNGSCFSFSSSKNCNCLTTTSQLKSFVESLQVDLNKSLFYASLIEPIDKLQNASEFYQCSIKIPKENNQHNLFDVPVTKSQFITFELWIFALVILISSICTSSIFTLSDTACFESVQKYKSDFGRQRAFGAIGWGAFAPIAGLLCDITNGFVATWLLMLTLLVLAIWNISNLDLVKPHFPKDLCKNVRSILKSTEFLAFNLAVFMNGCGAGILWFYLFWFITSIGGSKFLAGLVLYVESFAGEIPFMFFSGWFIKRLGHFNLLSLALLCYCIRFMWYSYLTNPWWILPVEIVHGFTYGTLHPTLTSFGKLSSKPGTEATTQAILFATHGGLGAGIGCILAGIGFDYFGGHLTFYYFSIFSFCACLLNVLNTVLLGRRHSQVLHVAPPDT